MIDRQAAVLAQKEEANRRQQELLKKNVAPSRKPRRPPRTSKSPRPITRWPMADAAVARAAIETARADLAHETTLLAHHILKAPFDAIVVERHTELGTVVKAGDPVYTIVDPDSVWVLAHVEEARAGAIALGQSCGSQLEIAAGLSISGTRRQTSELRATGSAKNAASG